MSRISLVFTILVLCATLGGCSSRYDSDWYPMRHPESEFREVDDEGGLVVLPERAEVKVLNAAGIRIFSLLDGEHTPEEIARAVVDEFEVDYETALADAYTFLVELDDVGMLAGPVPKEIRDKASSAVTTEYQHREPQPSDSALP